VATLTDVVADTQLGQYVPVLMLLAVAVTLVGGMLLGSVLLGQRGRSNRIKNTAYECGMPPQGEGAPRLSVKFYRVAMLFILFDIEVVFLYPWAVVYREMLSTHAPVILGGMLSFIGILLVGYLYAVRQGALDWAD